MSDELPPKRCPACRGSGVVSVYREEEYVREDSYPRESSVEQCSECVGTGYDADDVDVDDVV